MKTIIETTFIDRNEYVILEWGPYDLNARSTFDSPRLILIL